MGSKIMKAPRTERKLNQFGDTGQYAVSAAGTISAITVFLFQA